MPTLLLSRLSRCCMILPRCRAKLSICSENLQSSCLGTTFQRTPRVKKAPVEPIFLACSPLCPLSPSLFQSPSIQRGGGGVEVRSCRSGNHEWARGRGRGELKQPGASGGRGAPEAEAGATEEAPESKSEFVAHCCSVKAGRRAGR
ncbi:hypothetical protein Q8A73_022261 [Channa argus]|nr:hypothetical protein Q8A73_022261 [Channa argus]